MMENDLLLDFTTEEVEVWTINELSLLYSLLIRTVMMLMDFAALKKPHCCNLQQCGYKIIKHFRQD